MSLGRGGGYCTCALALRARPIRNIKWRLQQDVNRRCFTMRRAPGSLAAGRVPHQLSIGAAAAWLLKSRILIIRQSNVEDPNKYFLYSHSSIGVSGCSRAG
jgi:hypothetical protein